MIKDIKSYDKLKDVFERGKIRVRLGLSCKYKIYR